MRTACRSISSRCTVSIRHLIWAGLADRLSVGEYTPSCPRTGEASAPVERRRGSAYLPGSVRCALARSRCAISARRDHTLAGSIGTSGSFNRRSSSPSLRAVFGVRQFAVSLMSHVPPEQILVSEGEQGTGGCHSYRGLVHAGDGLGGIRSAGSKRCSYAARLGYAAGVGRPW
jgi:hypothetical protein